MRAGQPLALTKRLSVVGLLILIGWSTTLPVTDASFSDTTQNTGNSFEAEGWKAVIDIDGGVSHACLARAEGYVWCWGRNDKGQLGNGTTVDNRTPVDVLLTDGGALADVVSLGAGAESNCAATDSGNVWCWGANGDGQLGDNTTTDRSRAVEVKGPGGTGLLAEIEDVASGLSHSCAAKSDGTAWCWGRNDRGQLGNNTTTNSLVPVQVRGPGGSGFLSDVEQIAAGAKFTCATKTDGSAFCWGDNGDGQLGDNTTVNRSAPVQVKGVAGVGVLASVAGVTTGEAFSCAVRTTGEVFCWGRNDKGQLGNNTTTDSTTPVQVNGVGGAGTLTAMTSVSAGQKHACAIRSDGGGYCWGLNGDGQLGDNSTTDRQSPVQVVGPEGTGTLGGSVLAGAGSSFSCAALDDYTAFCWGLNDRGQLGDNSTSDSSVPVQVKGGGWTGAFVGATDVAGGLEHTCVVRDGDAVWCWGRNDKGQLGDGTTDDSLVPVQVVGVGGAGTLTGVSAVRSGSKFTCATRTDGTVVCWGENGKGQLGDGTTVNSSFPVVVTGVGGTGTLTDVKIAVGGEEFACGALNTGGTVFCWGSNDKGQLGNSTTTDSATPVQVKGVGGTGNLGNVVALSTGLKHVCSASAAGSAFCWGLNNKGQLGDDTTTDSSSPVQVKGTGGSGNLGAVIAVSAGDSHSCAARTDQTVRCWGLNNEGQLGDNTTTDRLAPAQVTGPGGSGILGGVTNLAAGVEHTCASRNDGTAFCWGRNDKGQLGNNTTTDSLAPVQVVGAGGSGSVGDASDIGAGTSHTCIIRSEGAVWCWGVNLSGQLGDGETSNSSHPVRVL